MRKCFLLLLFLMLTVHPFMLFSQSLFDDYGTVNTSVSAAPYASLDLDAMDYNPAGIVFLGKGLEVSLSSQWPTWHTIDNHNVFTAMNENVERTCVERSKMGVPNPSVRFSYKYNNNTALSFSYAHGESFYEGNGNGSFDEAVQNYLSTNPIGSSLSHISNSIAISNLQTNIYATLLSLQYGMEIKPPYEGISTFPLALLSDATQYGCISNAFNVGSSFKRAFGNDEKWGYYSYYIGVKAQSMRFHQKTFTSIHYIDPTGQYVPLREVYFNLSDFYKYLESTIPDLPNGGVDIAQSYEALGQKIDSVFYPVMRDDSVKWGFNCVLGFDYIRPNYNIALKIEGGSLPFKAVIGYSQYVRNWQFNIGGDFGYADSNWGLYYKKFKGQLDDIKNYYGDIGMEVAYRFPRCYWTIKGGCAFGFNKDMLLNKGDSQLLKKQPYTFSPSCAFEWQMSSLLKLFGGFRVTIPSEKNVTIGNGGIHASNCDYTIHPQYQLSIGFVAHIE